jgi:NAD(P)-dependent dehydrogenase (short-subunit alcohol dehydrogenase family)
MASNNSTVIVTGAASGIGLAIAIGLMTAGNDVIAADQNAAALKDLAARAAGLKGGVTTVTADLALQGSFGLIAGVALVKYGRIDAGK